MEGKTLPIILEQDWKLRIAHRMHYTGKFQFSPNGGVYYFLFSDETTPKAILAPPIITAEYEVLPDEGHPPNLKVRVCHESKTVEGIVSLSEHRGDFRLEQSSPSRTNQEIYIDPQGRKYAVEKMGCCTNPGNQTRAIYVLYEDGSRAILSEKVHLRHTKLENAAQTSAGCKRSTGRMTVPLNEQVERILKSLSHSF